MKMGIILKMSKVSSLKKKEVQDRVKTKQERGELVKLIKKLFIQIQKHKLHILHDIDSNESDISKNKSEDLHVLPTCMYQYV